MTPKAKRFNVRGRAPYAAAARELLRDSLLDAAANELDTRVWENVTMSDVAKSAGVSRQTLYNEFGSRNDFAQAFVLREVDGFLEPVQVAISEHLDDPPGAVAAALGAFLEAAAAHPLVQAVVQGEGNGELLRLVTTRGGPVIEHAVQRITEIIGVAWPQVAREDAELLAEGVVRLAVSMAALPQGPTGMGATGIAKLFGPYIELVLSEANAAAQTDPLS